jgi:WD40 repeat protein
MTTHPTPQRRATTDNRLFISYSRADSVFVHSLYDHLAQDHDVGAWVDWEDIPPSAEWMAEIKRGIDSADAFAFIITPRSLSSSVCAEELAHAVSGGKRLLPIVLEEPHGITVPDALAKLNWIMARTDAERRTAAAELAQALLTDLPALRMHARLLVRAREWLATGREPSYLLRGTDLDDAQRWLSAVSPNGPFPSAEHREYLLASQQAQRAETQRWQQLYRQAQARLLAAQSELLRAQDVRRIELSALLAAASLRIEPTVQASQSLQQGLRLLPPRVAMTLTLPDRGVDDLAATPDGKWLLTAGSRIVGAQDTWSAATAASYDTGRSTSTAQALHLSPDAALLAVCGYRDADIMVLSVPQLSPVGRLHHPSEVTAVSWLPHTSHLITACADRRLRRWDPATATVITDLPTPGATVAVACSPDGDALACAAADGTLAVLDLPVGQLRWSQALGARLTDLCFSPDGRRIATAGWDQQGRVFDATCGEPQSAVHHSAVVTRVRFSPDGELLATASDDGTAAVMTVVAGEVIARLEPHGGVFEPTFSPDGRWLATHGFSILAQVWDIAEQTEIARIPGTGLANAVAFTPDGAQLAVARPDGVDTVRLDRDSPDIPLRHGLRLQCAAFDAAGRIAALAPGNSTVEVADLTDGHRIARFTADIDIEFMQVSSDGAMVLTQADATGVLTAWETATGRVLWRTDPDEQLRRATLSDCGRYVLVCPFYPQTTVNLMCGADGSFLATLPHSGVFAPCFSPDGEHFLTTTDNDIALRRTVDGTVVRTVTHSAEVMGTAFSPDGSQLAAIAKDGAVNVWACSTGQQFLHVDHDGEHPVALAISGDGRWLATAGTTNVCVWDAANAQQVHQFPVEAATEYLRFTPDNAFVAAGSRDERARIWSLTDGAETACISTNGEVFTLQFSHDGEYVLIEHCKTQRYRTAWRWRPADLLTLAEASVTRTLTPQEWTQTVGGDMPMPLAAASHSDPQNADDAAVEPIR